MLAILLNLVVLANALLHDPRIGYDANKHLRYIVALSEGRLPRPHDSGEFFAPPLYYALPSLVFALTKTDSRDPREDIRTYLGRNQLAMLAACKTAQLFNVLCSVVLCIFLLKLCQRLKAGWEIRMFALLFLMLLPVYYRTFAMVRPEPLLACLYVVTAWQALKTFSHATLRRRDSVVLGVLLGLMLLTRQSALPFIAPLVLLGVAAPLSGRVAWRPALTQLSICFLAAFAVHGWFYWHLHNEYGSPFAFNKAAASPGLADVKDLFALEPQRIFSDPVRVEKEHEDYYFQTLYEDTWGDYEGYFLVFGKLGSRYLSGERLEEALQGTGRRQELQTNRWSIVPYLTAINRLALFPTMLAIAGALWGLMQLYRALIRRRWIKFSLAPAFLFAVFASVLGGHIAFILRYDEWAKATYVIMMYPFLALLTADMFCKAGINRGVRDATAVACLTIYIAFLPAFFTRYLPDLDSAQELIF